MRRGLRLAGAPSPPLGWLILWVVNEARRCPRHVNASCDAGPQPWQPSLCITTARQSAPEAYTRSMPAQPANGCRKKSTA
ncbi:hypothetical protein BaRGS_00036843 [Batillaria attramentaria]|uniref:Secreted protein n=1 Tax=Batillaria attramentaria TaxID=370345 RepID=A0ABD0JAA9_9CAEN